MMSRRELSAGDKIWIAKEVLHFEKYYEKC